EAIKQSRDLCDRELAHSFRYDLLAQGGQKPGMEMYRKFRGADPDKTAMLKARGLWQEPEPVDTLNVEVEATEQSVDVVRPVLNPKHEAKPKVLPTNLEKKPIKL
ncbi:MAG: hypothetical protein J6V05_04950, partial [Alistipes sp.]|nr:hypothetical protein [Alistipes sp.]